MRIPAPATKTVGLIYVMRSGERVKIGWARNVEKRRAELQTGSPERLEVVVVFPGTRAEEAGCHRRFAADRIDEGGQEWFRLSDDIQAFIAEQRQAHGDLQQSIENDARFRALWEWCARWPWNVIDQKFKRPFVPPEFLTAHDIHRAIMTFDSRPVRLTRMIQAIDSGETTVAESDREEWPAIVFRAYIKVEPDPQNARAMRRLFFAYSPHDLVAYEQPIDWAFAIKRLRELQAEDRARLS
jgi:Meiotically up-regulated gene 113